MKDLKIISATEARNRWFELLNLVYFKGTSILVEKNKVPMIKLIPAGKVNLRRTDELLEETFGFLKSRKTYWPSEDKKVIKREKRYLDRLWKQ